MRQGRWAHTFDSGLTVGGPEGLDLMSLSCRMTSPVPNLFRARIHSFAFDDLHVTRTRAQHLVSVREKDMVEDSVSEHLQIDFLVAGGMHTDHQRRTFTTEAGQVAILFPGDPFTVTVTEPAESVQFYLPVSFLAEHGLSPRDLAGFGGEPSPIGLATRQFLTSLSGGSSGPVSAMSAGAVSRALLELGLGMLLEMQGGQPAPADVREALRVRARAHVARRAHDPDLSVDQVAAHIGTSRRYLQSLFTDEPLGVGDLIRDVRLQRAAENLLMQPSLPIGRVALATGFRGPDQFNRAFRSAYGDSPSEFRRRNQRLGPPDEQVGAVAEA
ncbi:AraC family transcriptional regulator [Humibacillus sp. DSM 29435]|uniref:AraC family transcriptional regulator n=1 Tax=Humibacillus sp. DSM 29435 TaxID=1869167 RepID=UPI001585E92C|nr:AraC family transcriptional regulator [Humibacillus sp. DSM 29435]